MASKLLKKVITHFNCRLHHLVSLLFTVTVSFVIILLPHPARATTLTDFPFSLAWNYAFPITFTTTPTISTAPHCFHTDKSILNNSYKSDFSDIWFVLKASDGTWYAPIQDRIITNNILRTCFLLEPHHANAQQYAVIFGNPQSAKAPLLPTSANATSLDIISPTVYQANTKNLIGDIGMKSNVGHVLFYSLIDQKMLLDCKNYDTNGHGPSGNLITEADNSTANANIVALTNKCALTNPEGTQWHYWQGNIFSNLPVSAEDMPTISHSWTQPINDTLWGGSFTATYPDNIAKHELVWHKTPGNSATIFSGTTTTSTKYWTHGTVYPHANELTATLGDTSAIWEGTIIFNTIGNISALRLTLPQIMACWSHSTGKSCYGQNPPVSDGVTHYVSYDINPGHADGCTDSDRSGCPPFHKDITGKLIPKDNTTFPHDAYYLWCGSSLAPYEPKCPGLEESFNLQPSSTWEPYGFPSSPYPVNTPKFFSFDVIGLQRHLFHTKSPDPSITYSIDTSTEILGAGATLTYSTSDWKLTGLKSLTALTQQPSSHPGDLDGDGHVNYVDFNVLISNFGNPYTIFDFNAIVSNYGN